MGPEVISGAAAVALAVAAAFVLLAVPARRFLPTEKPSSRFRGAILPEPAQQHRHRVAALGRYQELVTVAVLVFLAAFAAALPLLPGSRVQGLPRVLLFALALAAAAALTGAVVLLIRLAVARRRARFVRDAGIAVGQGLLKLTGTRNRVFHDVPCGKAVIDNVLVGLHGIYAVFVIARRPGRHNRLRLQGDQLLFAPGNYRLPLAPLAEQSELLARELRKALNVALRVRLVLAVPGWEIENQADEACLVVNERNLVMLRGWKDSADYLMHEDVERAQEILTERCLRFGADPATAPVSFRAATGTARA
jgi:hypothetical protein